MSARARKQPGSPNAGQSLERSLVERQQPELGMPAHRWYVPVVVVFALALGMRLTFLHDIRDIGFFEHPVSDGRIYVERAVEIAAGDWLGPDTFVHAPLYAYALGLVRLCGADDLLTPRVVQMLGGALACVLLLAIGWRLFGLPTAALAGLILAAYPPALFFDGLIQKTSLALLLSTVALWLLIRGAAAPTWWRWGLAGVTLGLLVLTRQNALLLVPLLLIWLWLVARRHSRHRRAVWVLAALVGLGLTLLPWAVRNRVVTGEFVLTTPNLGQNFAMGNHPDATGTYLPFKRGRASAQHEQTEWIKAAEEARRRTLSASEVSDYYLEAALRWIKANPGAWLKLTGRKWLMVWNAYETPDTEDYYLYREWSPLLRGLDRVLHFGVLCPLAVAGIVLTWARWRELWLLYGWLLITAAGVTAFVVFARYRFPLIPVLVLFAAAGIVETVSAVRRRAWRKVALALLTVTAAGFATNWPVAAHRRMQPFSYTNHAVALADRGRHDEATHELEKALALSPDDVDAHLTMGSVLLDLRQYEQAWQHYNHARRGDPDYPGVYRGLGNALMGLARFAEAAEQYESALHIDARDHVALNLLATARARQGRVQEALRLFARVLELAPDYAEAHLNLGNTYLSVNRPNEAAAAYEAALRHRPGYTDAFYNLGVVEMGRGRVKRAIEHFTSALEQDPGHQRARRDLDLARQANRRGGKPQP